MKRQCPQCSRNFYDKGQSSECCTDCCAKSNCAGCQDQFIGDMRMRCIPTDQGIGNSNTALCNTCFTIHVYQMQARANAVMIDNIDSEVDFIDCSGNEAVYCCICGKDIYGNTNRV